MSFVNVKNLAKSYKNTKVFDNINFTIEEGELITLLGPSGCGKTTILRCIAGFENVDNGQILVENNDITKLSPKDRDVSMVFQAYALFPNMTVEENIGFGLKMMKENKEVIKEKVSKMIEIVQLKGKEKSYPNQISGGQAQRAALARALVMKPKILLLDEPLSALDAKIRKNLRLEIRRIQKKLNITTIFVTHDQEEALIISDRIFVMDKGKISQIGNPKEIYSSPKNEFVAGFIGNYNVFTKDELVKLSHNQVNDEQLDEEVFAVRPESIYIINDDNITILSNNGIKINGKIEDVIVLGNILRYYLNVDNKIILVDELNRDENYLKVGQTITAYIKQSEIKKVK